MSCLIPELQTAELQMAYDELTRDGWTVDFHQGTWTVKKDGQTIPGTDLALLCRSLRHVKHLVNQEN